MVNSCRTWSDFNLPFQLHLNMIPTLTFILTFLKSDRDDKISENNDPVNRNVGKHMNLLIEDVA